MIRILLLTLVSLASAAAQYNTLSVPLQPVAARKPAAAFVLRDLAGKTATLKQYRGKVVLLDFWATWCTGCKQEIPWFVEFQKRFGTEHLAVVGVSLDDGGWNVLRPFLTQHPVPYRMLLGDQATAHQYGIENMPNTFLIDRKGRVAAAYIASVVDRDSVQANLTALLSER